MSPEEEQFYLQWEKDRIVPHFKRKPFLRGLSISLSLGLLILIMYERATMVGNMQGNEIWIVIAIIAFSLGFAWIYQQFTFEMNEQRYKELKYLKNKK